MGSEQRPGEGAADDSVTISSLWGYEVSDMIFILWKMPSLSPLLYILELAPCSFFKHTALKTSPVIHNPWTLLISNEVY